MMDALLALPAASKRAADLDDRERLALAHAAGIPIEFDVEVGLLTMRATVPFVIGDRHGGGFLIARRAT